MIDPRRMVSLTVRGIPQPKGSTKAFVPKGWTRAIVTENNPKTRPWASLIRLMAQQQAPKGGPVKAPIELTIIFDMPMPQAVARKPVAPLHTTRPDLDKLVRTVKDALKGVIYCDDSQVYRILTEKRYGVAPGVWIKAAWEESRAALKRSGLTAR